MKPVIRIATVAGLTAVGAVCSVGLVAGPAAAAPAAGRSSVNQAGDHAGVVFTQTDALTGNAVVVYDRDADGTLSAAGTYRTDGLGGQLSGSVVDHTASQGALTYDRRSRMLYAVNAGSNTVTAFAVRGDRLTRLQTIGSGGDFPVSVTVHGALVYVLNARGGGSVQGFALSGGRLVRIPAWHRDLGFDPNPASEFTSTPGQIAFTPDGSKLVVTTKGDGQSIEVFPVSWFGPAPAPVVTPDPGNVPFAVAFDRRQRLVVAEAGPSAVAVFRVNRDATVSLISRTATGQAATCWVTVTGRHVYASNAGSADVSGYADRRGELSALGTTATDPGTVDSAASPDGRYLYVQTGAHGVVDEFRIGAHGRLTAIGSVAVANGVGGEGIATS